MVRIEVKVKEKGERPLAVLRFYLVRLVPISQTNASRAVYSSL
jgi:hypothetical protein